MITDIKLSMETDIEEHLSSRVESKFGNYFYKPRRSELDTLFKEVIDKIGGARWNTKMRKLLKLLIKEAILGLKKFDISLTIKE